MASQALSPGFEARQGAGSKWSEARILLILDDIASGYFTTSQACERAGVSLMAWSRWTRADETLSTAYAEAREVGHDAMADQCIAIADGALPADIDYRADAQRAAVALNAPAGASSVVTRLLAGAGLELARDRMRIDARLKLLASWDKRYSPKNSVELTGKDGGPIRLEDKGDAIALSQQLRDMKRARLGAAPAQLEHGSQPGAAGDEG